MDLLSFPIRPFFSNQCQAVSTDELCVSLSSSRSVCILHHSHFHHVVFMKYYKYGISPVIN